MFYMHNQWYDISCAILYMLFNKIHKAVPQQDQFFLQPHNIWTYRVLRKLPHTKFATYSL